MIMMKKNLFLLIALVAALTVYGKKTTTETSFMEKENLAGTWIIDTTIIKQTVDSVSNTKTYLAGDTAVTFVKRPLKVIITDDEITFEYADGEIQSGTYTVDDNKLLVGFPTHGAIYQFDVTEAGKLQLFYTAEYVIDGEHQAEEQCVFKGRATSETEN
jgi:hemin uptake protein HemP